MGLMLRVCIIVLSCLCSKIQIHLVPFERSSKNETGCTSATPNAVQTRPNGSTAEQWQSKAEAQKYLAKC